MTAFLALAGLSYVYLTLQLYHLGERRKAVENELASLRTQNDIASAQIAAFTSRSGIATAIERRLPENDSDFRVETSCGSTMPPRSSDEEAVQPVANPLPQHESK